MTCMKSVFMRKITIISKITIFSKITPLFWPFHHVHSTDEVLWPRLKCEKGVTKK